MKKEAGRSYPASSVASVFSFLTSGTDGELPQALTDPNLGARLPQGLGPENNLGANPNSIRTSRFAQPELGATHYDYSRMHHLINQDENH
jgi:hypothetical protein